MEPETASPFRAAALEQLQREQDPQELLRVSPPWTWSLVWALGLLAAAALVGAFLVRVEVRSLGRGALRPGAGVRLLLAQVGGTMGAVRAHNGDRLKAGQTIARIEAAQVQVPMVEADRQLALLRGAGRGFSAREERLTQEQLETVRAELAAQESLLASFDDSVAFENRNIANIRKLIEAGLEARFKQDEAQDQLASVLRQREAAMEQVARLRQELAALGSARERQLWQQVQELNGVQSRRAALESSRRQTEIQAPLDGFLEAFVARPGDVVQPGQALAKVVPAGSGLQAVAFLAEQDRAEVNTGAVLALELDAFPFAEFGTLKGRILRIGSDLASPYEVREALGEEARLDGPAYRVELELLPDRPRRLRNVDLQPGMQFQARFTRGRQRLITLVLDPLRRWLD